MLSADAIALLQAEAYCEGRAVPATARRHLRVADEPLVLTPLTMAGEDGALLAVGIGSSRHDMELLVCPEPRNRDLAQEALDELAARICAWLDPLAKKRRVHWFSPNYAPRLVTRAPQIVVPTPAAATLLRRLAEAMGWGGHGPKTTRRAGGWLWFFCDRHEVLGAADSCLLVATEAQLLHWVPPISGPEAAHLLALNAAIAPPQGMSAVAAARAAENEPGSTMTTPEFDERRLQPAIEAFNRALRHKLPKKTSRRRREIAALLRPCVQHLYAACHDALDRLRSLAPVPPVDDRRLVEERRSFTKHADYLDGGGHFGSADSLKRGLFLVDDAEQEVGRVEREARFYDPVVRAVASATGEALDGVLVSKRIVKRPRRQAYRVEVRVKGPWRAPQDTEFQLVCDEPGIAFEVASTEERKGATTVTLESSGPGAQALFKVVGPQLKVAKPIAFAAGEREFPTMRLPHDLPWMLKKGS